MLVTAIGPASQLWSPVIPVLLLSLPPLSESYGHYIWSRQFLWPGGPVSSDKLSVDESGLAQF